MQISDLSKLHPSEAVKILRASLPPGVSFHVETSAFFPGAYDWKLTREDGTEVAGGFAVSESLAHLSALGVLAKGDQGRTTVPLQLPRPLVYKVTVPKGYPEPEIPDDLDPSSLVVHLGKLR